MTDAPDPFYPPEVADAWESGRRQGRMDARKVKPLVWVDFEGFEGGGAKAESHFGQYDVYLDDELGWLCKRDGHDDSWVKYPSDSFGFGTKAAAQAASQSDRERRALSELVDL